MSCPLNIAAVVQGGAAIPHRSLRLCGYALTLVLMPELMKAKAEARMSCHLKNTGHNHTTAMHNLSLPACGLCAQLLELKGMLCPSCMHSLDDHVRFLRTPARSEDILLDSACYLQGFYA